MVDLKGLNTSKILEEIEALVVVFDASGIIFSNKAASEWVEGRSWRSLFFTDDVLRGLTRFFASGELMPDHGVTLHYGSESKQRICHWRFREISSSPENRVCMALGKIEESHKVHSQRLVPLLGNAEEVDRFRFLGSV